MSPRCAIAASPVGVMLGAAITIVFDTKFAGCVGLMVVLAALAAGAVASYYERGARLRTAVRTGAHTWPSSLVYGLLGESGEFRPSWFARVVHEVEVLARLQAIEEIGKRLGEDDPTPVEIPREVFRDQVRRSLIDAVNVMCRHQSSVAGLAIRDHLTGVNTGI